MRYLRVISDAVFRKKNFSRFRDPTMRVYNSVKNAFPRVFGENNNTENTVVDPIPRVANKLTPADHEVINQPLMPIDKTIAVFVHLYYVDLLDEILDELNNIDVNFTLMLAVFSENDYVSVKNKLNGYRNPTVVKICQNRGRNFGPMLVDFREVSNYDILLHIHSKKSLRIGKEDSAWRHDIYHGLIGSVEIVHAILNELVINDNVGLVYSESQTQPEWVHHNLDSPNTVMERIGLGKSDCSTRDFLNFPIGAMFWCKTKAIKPLIEYKWEYTDFEPEPVSDGGSVMHDIEHYLCEIVKKEGYDYICNDFNCWTYRINDSKKHIWGYNERLSLCVDSIKTEKIISFDFYDTLFSRVCTIPEDIFWYIGFSINKEYGTDIDFISIRKDSELKARVKKNWSDVNIDEIYQSMAESKIISIEIVESAKQKELSLERKVLVPRKDVIALARIAKGLGKKVIISSDTYMPASFIRSILNDHGMCDLFDEIRVSNEMNLRKDNRTYWSFVKGAYFDGGFVHFGDNPESDIHAPARIGIPALYVMNPLPMASIKGIPIVSSWNKTTYKQYSGGILLGPILSKAAINAFSTKVEEPYSIKSFYDLGYMLIAPTLFSFNTWLCKKIIDNKYTKIIFFSREGYYLKKLYDLVRKHNNKLPDSSYMYISRTFSIGSSLCNDYSSKRIVECGDYSDGTIYDLVQRRCGISLDSDDGECYFNKEISLPRDSDYVCSMLDDISEELVDKSRAINDVIVDYSGYLGLIGSDENVAIVDIGYSATIQKSLQIALCESIHGLYLSLIEKSEGVKDQNGTAFSFLNQNGLPKNEVMGRYSLLLESLLTAPHGHVVSVMKKGEGYSPICEDDPDMAHMSVNDQIFAGITEYFDNMISTYGEYVLDIQFDPTDLEVLFDYINNKKPVSKEIEENIFIEQAFNGKNCSYYHLFKNS